MLEPRGEYLGKTPLAHLGLRALDRIWDPAELGRPLVEIEQQPGRARIAVTGLADGAGIEQPPAVQRDLGAPGCRPAADAAVVRGDRQRDVAMPDEDERRVRELERRVRRLLCQHVLPDRVARARVEQVDAIDLTERLQ